MSDLSTRNKAWIRQNMPRVAEALDDHEVAINNLGQQANASPVGITPAPTAPSALTVTGGAGYFRAHIQDNSPSYRGKEFFLEAAEAGTNFAAPHVMHLGATTSHYVNLGEKALDFRAYSVHATSGPSKMVYHMGVSGVGGTAPSVTGNTAGGAGYGLNPYTTDTPPKRQ